MYKLDFRVFDKFEKTYWFPENIEANIQWLMNPEEYKNANYPPDCVEIEHWTGLYDVNKNKIYENDVIMCINGYTYVIEWLEDKLCYVARPLHNSDECFESLDITINKWLIICNIHNMDKILGDKLPCVISKNMGENWQTTIQLVEPCKDCGFPPILAGQPLWEWWEHYVSCSNLNCKKHNDKICSGTSPVEDILILWNERNKK